MNEILADIKARLQAREYINEEHVRLSLVARLLQALGWNIWSPAEVNAEFVVVPNEDAKKVDLALFILPTVEPMVFIEIKAVGHIQVKLAEVEQQLRNYNRDNQAMFTVITDGRNWRFYLASALGEFSKRCFKTADLIDDELDEVEFLLSTFLNKSEIENGNAKRKAEEYLHLNQVQRAAEDCLPDARKVIAEPPYPTLPQALIELVQRRGHVITHEDALKFIHEAKERKPIVNPSPVVNIESSLVHLESSHHGSGSSIQLDPDRPGSLTHTKMIEGRFDDESAVKWSDLIDCAVRRALKKGVPDKDVQAIVNLQEGKVNDRGFHPIRDTIYSVQGMDANNCWRECLRLAKKSNSEILVRFEWRAKEGAAHPGHEGLLKWSP
jgi:hypothetical protein